MQLQSGDHRDEAAAGLEQLISRVDIAVAGKIQPSGDL